MADEEQILGVYKIRIAGGSTAIRAPGTIKGDRYVVVQKPRGVLVYYPLDEYPGVKGEGVKHDPKPHFSARTD